MARIQISLLALILVIVFAGILLGLNVYPELVSEDGDLWAIGFPWTWSDWMGHEKVLIRRPNERYYWKELFSNIPVCVALLIFWTYTVQTLYRKDAQSKPRVYTKVVATLAIAAFLVLNLRPEERVTWGITSSFDPARVILHNYGWPFTFRTEGGFSPATTHYHALFKDLICQIGFGCCAFFIINVSRKLFARKAKV